MAVQVGVGEESGGVAGDGLGDRFGDQAGQGPFQGWAVDPGVGHLDERGAQVVCSGQGEPAGDRTVAQDGLGQSLTVQDQRAAGNGGGAGHAAFAPPCVCCCRAW